ncbi:MAG: toxic anion resistance protein, partial [Bacillota bacterium]|nr:toxic anion resistance protein [Bacillota bacterium]
MEEKSTIQLTLGGEEKEEEKVVAKVEAPPKGKLEIDDSQLSEEEKAAVEEFSKKIDITSSELVLQYGAQAQQKIADFSDKALENVKTKDMGEVGDMMTNLVGELKSFEAGETEKKGIFGFFKKQKDKLSVMKARYDSVEANVDKIVKNLEN